MKHEKIYERFNGYKIKINVSFSVYNNDAHVWDHSIEVLAKGKRNWLMEFTGSEYDYNQMRAEDKRRWLFSPTTQLATAAEIWTTKMELWEKLKPL